MPEVPGAAAEVAVSVCACTRRRPEGLRRLLQALGAMDKPPGGVEVVVVENDDSTALGPSGFARLRSAISELRGLEVGYWMEPRQNIALARNLAVANARGAWIAFIDDDEVPGHRWLTDLLTTAIERSADGVFGPVIAQYPPEAPEWVRDTLAYTRPRCPTGYRLSAGLLRTGNALVSRAVLAGVHGPFDSNFGLSGGEDSLLFAQLLKRGCRFVWCDTAEVTEILEGHRVTLPWLARRSFCGGQTYARLSVVLEGYGSLLRDASRGVVALCAGIVMGMACWPFSKGLGARWLLRGAAGLGKITAILPVYCRRRG